MILLDGRVVRDKIAQKLREKIAGLPLRPTLAIVQIGNRDDSNAYIRQKKKFAELIGAKILFVKLPESVTETEITNRISALNKDNSARGIILQLPVPEKLNRTELLDAIAPEKDVDGLSSASRLRLADGDASGFVPATARGIFELLSYYKVSVAGKKVAVFGRSLIAGGPIAALLSAKGAVVSVIHSKTPIKEAREISRASDIIVVAIGKPRHIGAEYFRNDKTQIVIDVGITAVTEKGAERLEKEVPRKKLVGDIDFDAVKNMVSAISPVPGGVGPMTVVALFQNLCEAYQRSTA